MKIVQVFIKNSYQNFNYIVYSEKTKVAIHFDPYDIDQTLSQLPENINIKYLLNTHKHWDHIKDNDKLMQNTGCELKQLQKGEKLFLSENEYVQALFTPGHVDDHFCYLLVQNEKPIGLIAGDTLFNAGVGNCKNGGNVEDLFLTTTNIINNLDLDILVYPSHDYMKTNLNFALSITPDNEEIKKFLKRRENGYFVTTIKEEKRVNPFLRTDEEALKKYFPNMSSKEIFIKLRQLRDNW